MGIADVDRRRSRRRCTPDRRPAMDARDGVAANTLPENLEDKLTTWQEAERRRIAADLHDSIGSSLALVKFRLEEALKGVQADVPDFTTVECLAGIASEMNKTIEEVHRIAMSLRPSILDDLGIIATIGWFARELQGCRESVQVLQQISAQEKEIPNCLKTAIYRIMQEASNNAINHSGANLVRITLRQDDGTIRLSVEDNGMGFDMAKVLAKRDCFQTLGIVSMCQRAKDSGGSLVINSALGAGTQVIASWPRTVRS